ncbi:MAG: hypothetical protein JNM66_12620 [Bryobacterales bacterium]|nr:hypothetical protein [Bryobacterales bacterium]
MPSRMPPPPELHWLVVLGLSVATLGMFFYIWCIALGIWANKAQRSPFTLLLYIAAVALLVFEIVYSADATPGSFEASMSSLIHLAGAVPMIWANFRVRDLIIDYSSSVAGPWITCNGVLVFLFGPIYLQYKITEVRSYVREAAAFARPS